MPPGLLHQAIIEFLRLRPDMLQHLVADQAPALCAEGTSLEPLEGDLGILTPPEYDADLLVLVRRDDKPVLAAILEAQLHADPDKLLRWPVYASVARSRHRCDSIVVVLSMDREVARWAARPIVIGPGNVFRCVVIGPDTIPRILDPAQAHGVPELAVLSALAHADSQDAVPIALAALETFGSLDDDRASLYYDLMCVALPAAARSALENTMIKVDLNQIDTPAVRLWMDRGRKQGHEQGREEGREQGLEQGREQGLEQGREQGLEQGREEGQRELLLDMISDRFGAIPAEIEARVRSARSDDLRLWTKRLLSASSLSDIFGQL